MGERVLPIISKSQTSSPAQPVNPVFRRRFPRRQFFHPIGVLYNGTYALEAGVEIGEGGLLFTTEKPLEIGHSIVLSFFVPKRDLLVVKGLLLYVLKSAQKDPKTGKQKFSYGIKFGGLAFEGRRMIRDYIAEKTHQEG